VRKNSIGSCDIFELSSLGESAAAPRNNDTLLRLRFV
jgi:hypothetical protein